MVDDQINIAIRTRETLSKQRNTFKAFQTQMTTLASMILTVQYKNQNDLSNIFCLRSFSYDKQLDSSH